MISQKNFHELEMQYGCGYWNVCWEHACPCAITTENKGLQESIYNSLVQESREQVEMEFDNDDYEDFDNWYNHDEDEFDDYYPEDEE